MQGQINIDSNLGKIIYNFCKKDDINTIVEIGTWNGMGSTKCIKDAILDKKTPYNVFSIEAWKSMYDIAILNNKPIPNNFNIIHGRIIEIEELNWFDYNSLQEDEKKWLADDIENYKKCENIIYKIPSKIDLLILDGGEFSSYSEFYKLEDRSNYIILDDTNSRKFKLIREFVLKSLKYDIIYDVLNDRNGYMVLQNKKFIK